MCVCVYPSHHSSKEAWVYSGGIVKGRRDFFSLQICVPLVILSTNYFWDGGRSWQNHHSMVAKRATLGSHKRCVWVVICMCTAAWAWNASISMYGEILQFLVDNICSIIKKRRNVKIPCQSIYEIPQHKIVKSSRYVESSPRLQEVTAARHNGQGRLTVQCHLNNAHGAGGYFLIYSCPEDISKDLRGLFPFVAELNRPNA